jgi:hypothetical protein
MTRKQGECELSERNGMAHAPEQPPTAPPSPNGHDGANRGDGRTARGRFDKGNPGGPGIPFGRRLGKLQSALIDGLSDQDMAAVAQKLLAMTLAGNLDATRLLLSYAVGPPLKESVNPDRADLDELALLNDHPGADLDLDHTVPPAVAVALLRAYEMLGAVAGFARELDFPGPRPYLLAALKAAGMEDLARAGQAYRAAMAAREKAELAEEAAEREKAKG